MIEEKKGSRKIFGEAPLQNRLNWAFTALH